ENRCTEPRHAISRLIPQHQIGHCASRIASRDGPSLLLQAGSPNGGNRCTSVESLRRRFTSGGTGSGQPEAAKKARISVSLPWNAFWHRGTHSYSTGPTSTSPRSM